MIKKIVVGILVITGIHTVNAQSDMVQLLAAGKSESLPIITSYATPLLETFGNNLNNGWYSTADPLKLGRFTFTFGLTTSFVPKDKQSFVIDPANYHYIRTTGNVAVDAPTVFGSKTEMNNLFAYISNGVASYEKPIPLRGTGLTISPLPVAQLGIGLFKGTEVMIRFLPKINIDNYESSYWGLGIKHDIKQWMPFMSKLPFELSFIGAYTNAKLDITGKEFLKPEAGVNNPGSIDYTNQAINLSSTAWNVNLVISKKFTILTVFGGIRLSQYKSTLDIKGNYPITILNNAGMKEITNLADPFNIESDATNLGLNAGFRIKLGLIAFFAEGSLVPGGYHSVTGGLNIGFFN